MQRGVEEMEGDDDVGNGESGTPCRGRGYKWGDDATVADLGSDFVSF